MESTRGVLKQGGTKYVNLFEKGRWSKIRSLTARGQILDKQVTNINRISSGIG